MNGRPPLRFAAIRRYVAAVLCILVLLVSVHPAHATLQVNPANVTGSVVQAGDEGQATQDILIDHAACQCGCKVTAMPGTVAPLATATPSPAQFGAAATVSSHPAAVVPAQEPPRT